MMFQYPTHPAGSFHYPHLASLPAMASLQLTKLRQYRQTAATQTKPHQTKHKKPSKKKQKLLSFQAACTVGCLVCRNST